MGRLIVGRVVILKSYLLILEQNPRFSKRKPDKLPSNPAVSPASLYASSLMKLIVALGNPGPEYAQTRHNVGWMVMDELISRHGLDSPKLKFHSAMVDGQIIAGGKPHRCLLLKPQTYMNRSGLAVQEALQFYKLDPVQDLLVLVDDLAFDCGQIRLRGSGSPNGHNGLKDIENRIGTRSYARLRIGIDPKGRMNQSDYVLGKFSAEQRDRLEPALTESCKAVEAWLADGLDKAMNVFNQKG